MNHDPHFTIARSNALEIDCPYCRAPRWERCVDPRTGWEIENQPAHNMRMREAHVL